jgi:hypothetical protein
MIYRRGHQHEASEIAYREWIIAFLQNMVGEVFEAIWRFENQTVGIVLREFVHEKLHVKCWFNESKIN